MTSGTDPIASGSTVVSLVKVDEDPPRPAVLGLANGLPGPLNDSGKLPTSQVPDAAARACSTDGSYSLPTPSGVGFELVITATGLDDIRYNGASL